MSKNKDEKIISALLACPTIRAAAAACGVGESQIYIKLRDPDFKARYDEARRRLLEQATTALQGHLTDAVEVMAEVMNNDSASHQVRLNAAEAVLRNTLKLTEAVDITERLAALERRAAEEDA